MWREFRFLLLVLLGLAHADAAELESTPIEASTVMRWVEEAPEQAAARWDLSVTEWNRYLALMRGIRGAVSHPRISPVEVLGIHAREAAERRHYAERWARMMFEDTDRVLAFNRAYSEAFRRLYPNVPLIDTGREANASPLTLQPGERWLYFTDLACARCVEQLERLIGTLHATPSSGLDIYLTDTEPGEAGDAEARRWARRLDLPLELVALRRITINHANGLLDEIAPGASSPYLLRQHRGNSAPVALERW